MDEEPEELHVLDFSNAAWVHAYRERLERVRAEAYRRFREHLTQVFDLHGALEPDVLAGLALDALTVWHIVDSADRCRCSCHPRLPETDLHDFGFACTCSRTQQDRRRAWTEWGCEIAAFRESPEGQQLAAKMRAAETDLQDWMAVQHGVVVHSHGGLAPEQWRGVVDNHSFYFRERHGEWTIELDLHPSGHFARKFDGNDSDGTPQYTEQELYEGEVIACGTTDYDSYGTAPVERAQLIVDTIRTHLARQACTLHHGDLSSIAAVPETTINWCPACGSRLPTR